MENNCTVCTVCGGPLMAVAITSEMLDPPSGVNAYDCLRCGHLSPACGVSEELRAWFHIRNTERAARWALDGIGDKQAEILVMIAVLARELKAFREQADGRRLRLGPNVEGKGTP